MHVLFSEHVFFIFLVCFCEKHVTQPDRCIGEAQECASLSSNMATMVRANFNTSHVPIAAEKKSRVRLFIVVEQRGQIGTILVKCC